MISHWHKHTYEGQPPDWTGMEAELRAYKATDMDCARLKAAWAKRERKKAKRLRVNP